MIGRQLRQDPEFSPMQSLPDDIMRKFEMLERSEAQAAANAGLRAQPGDERVMCIAGAPEDESSVD